MNLEQLKISLFNYFQRIGKDDDYNLETSDDVDISLFILNGEFKSYLNNSASADVVKLLKEYDDIDMTNLEKEIAEDIEQAELKYDEEKCLDVEIEHEKEDDEISSEDEKSDPQVASESQSNVENDASSAVLDDGSNIYLVVETGAEAPVEAPVEVPVETPAEVPAENSSEPVFEDASVPVEAPVEAPGDQTLQTADQSANEAEDFKAKEKNYTSYVKHTLDEMYQDEDVVKALDLDGDGALNDEEKAQFEEYAKGYNTSSDRLTKKALDDALKDIKDGEFSYENDPAQRASAQRAQEAQEREEKIQEREKARNEKKAERASAANASRRTGGAGGVGGYGGASYGGGGASGISASTSPVEQGPTLEELETQKSEKQTELSTAQDEVKDIYSGENPAVSAAQDDCDKAQEDYQEKVDADKNISEELKEEMELNLDNITAQEQYINGIQLQINEANSQISQQKSAVSADESNLNALKQALSTVESKNTDNPEKQKEIDSMKTTIQAEIEKATSQLEEDKTALEASENEKTELESELKENEANLEKLNEEKAEIDKKILENCSESTKDALEAFNSAKENVEKVKAQELETAQGKITTLQGDIDELDAKINEMKAKQTQDEYKVGGEFADAFDESRFKGTVLDGKGEFIEDLCEKYNIDPYLVGAIIASETGFGTSNAIVNSNNPGGYMDSATNYQTVKKFATLDEGLEAVISNLAKNYTSQGLTTIQTIGNKYCPVGAANDPTGLNKNWVGNVTQFYNDLSGKNINKDTDIS